MCSSDRKRFIVVQVKTIRPTSAAPARARGRGATRRPAAVAHSRAIGSPQSGTTSRCGRRRGAPHRSRSRPTRSCRTTSGPPLHPVGGRHHGDGLSIRSSSVAGLRTTACSSCRRRQPATTSSGSPSSAGAGARPCSTKNAYVRRRSSRSASFTPRDPNASPARLPNPAGRDRPRPTAGNRGRVERLRIEAVHVRGTGHDAAARSRTSECAPNARRGGRRTPGLLRRHERLRPPRRPQHRGVDPRRRCEAGPRHASHDLSSYHAPQLQPSSVDGQTAVRLAASPHSTIASSWVSGTRGSPSRRRKIVVPRRTAGWPRLRTALAAAAPLSRRLDHVDARIPPNRVSSCPQRGRSSSTARTRAPASASARVSAPPPAPRSSTSVPGGIPRPGRARRRRRDYEERGDRAAAPGEARPATEEGHCGHGLESTARKSARRAR